jgi:hypothetical protein
MQELPKRLKRLIREWEEEAHERELHRELSKLDESFAEWRRGAIGSGEMSYRIHEWEIGPSRALFKEYNDGSPEMSLAYAIVIGIVQEDEVPPEVLEAIANAIAFYRSYQEKDQLAAREGIWWRR